MIVRSSRVRGLGGSDSTMPCVIAAIGSVGLRFSTDARTGDGVSVIDGVGLTSIGCISTIEAFKVVLRRRSDLHIQLQVRLENRIRRRRVGTNDGSTLAETAPDTHERNARHGAYQAQRLESYIGSTSEFADSITVLSMHRMHAHVTHDRSARVTHPITIA